MDFRPKVSLIISIYNVGRFLRECLQSAAAQNLKELEIICVNDASPDDCADIIDEFVQKDSRFISIRHEKNLGTMLTRRDGLMQARGEYVMFMDGDDTMVPEACARAYQAIEEYGTDILQFGTAINNYAHVPEARIKMNEGLLKPIEGKYGAKDIVRACFQERKFSVNLCNKIIRREIIYAAWTQMDEIRLLVAEDLYAFFLIAYCSRSAAGLEDKLYCYRFGVGIIGGNELSLQNFTKLLTEREVYLAMKRFLQRNRDTERYADILQGVYQRFLHEALDKWERLLSLDAKSKGFSLLLDTYGEDVIPAMAAQHWTIEQGKNLLQMVCDCESLRSKPRSRGKILTIAFYYRSIENGGAQRVTVDLCNLLAKLRASDGRYLFRVILITDERVSEHEYPLEKRVQRDFLPSFLTAVGQRYRERHQAWSRIISEHDVDIVISGMWVAESTMWDMLSVKSQPTHPAFVQHNHNFCCLPYLWGSAMAMQHIYRYRLADGLVSLSACDNVFYRSFNPRSKYIVNPLSYDPSKVRESKRKPGMIMWCGRISEEKQPLDAVRMLARVVQKVPEASLYVVGGGNEARLAECRQLAEELGVADNIIFTGFTLHPERYYREASVFVCTSDYEGFSLTIAEAMAHALPVVTYDMPWLPLLENGQTACSVPQGRYDLLARETAALLLDSVQASALGRAGRKQLLELYRVDIASEWCDFLHSVAYEEKPPLGSMQAQDIIFRYLTEFQDRSKSVLIQQRDQARKSLAEVQKKTLKVRSQAADVQGGLLVYGVGAHLDDMLGWHQELEGLISRIFDKDKEKIGRKMLRHGIVVESPEALKAMPSGTRVAIAAIRYYEEIVAELKQINPGLECLDIDRAMVEWVPSILQRRQAKLRTTPVPAQTRNSGQVTGRVQSTRGGVQPVQYAMPTGLTLLQKQRLRGLETSWRWRQRLLIDCARVKHIFWGAHGTRSVYLRQKFASLMGRGDIFIDENPSLSGKTVAGLPVCKPDMLHSVQGKFLIIVLARDYAMIRERLRGYGYIENVDFVEGRMLLGEDENGLISLPRVDNSQASMILYGYGAHLQDMLKWHPEIASCVVRVIDKDEKKAGHVAKELGCVIEPIDVLRELPTGTEIVIAAIRYFREIKKDIHEINPGLVCKHMDYVWREYL